MAFAYQQTHGSAHVVVSAIEHHAVLHAAEALTRHGIAVTVLPVDGDGMVHVDDVAAALRPDTALVSVMYANNEIGTIQPIAEIAALCRARGVLCHTDAVQAAGLLDLNVQHLGVDMLSMTAHKCYGPKGVGAMYVKRGTPSGHRFMGAPTNASAGPAPKMWRVSWGWPRHSRWPMPNGMPKSLGSPLYATSSWRRLAPCPGCV